MKKAVIKKPKTIDMGKNKGKLNFTTGQTVYVVKQINPEQLVIENDFGDKCSYLITDLKLL